MQRSPLENVALDRFVSWLRQHFGARLESVVLFGSRARGEGDEHSDLDVLVLVRGLSRADRGAVLDEAWRLEELLRLTISPLVRDPQSWRSDTALTRAIAADGVAL